MAPIYTDTILFILGGAGLAATLGLAAYLFASRSKSRSYKTALLEETEFYGTLTALAAGEAPSTLLLEAGAEATEPLATELLGDSADTATEPLGGVGALPLASSEVQAEEALASDLDVSALEGRYQLLREIHGGGMSRIFLARSTKLGNLWIVKYIPSHIGALQSEENILKLLNHNSLPRIIDIFHGRDGTYLVESYIEGVSLDKVLAAGQRPNRAVVLDWAEQLAQVLAYLHGMQPHPIFHFDLKPQNIMVTHDSRLVLIDFGISKRHGADSDQAVGITYGYAAPEQIRHAVPEAYEPMIRRRFGTLPQARMQWPADARTDLYSLGIILFELATGQAPTQQNGSALRRAVSQELAGIIEKCLMLEPDRRYQSAGALLKELQQAKGSRFKMARALVMRRVASVSTALALVVSVGGLGGGYYVYGQENLAQLDIAPQLVTLSLQQSSALVVEKVMPGGQTVTLDNAALSWHSDQEGVVQVDGNRIVGLNVGSTQLEGQYRNKRVSLQVSVVQPMEGMVDIVQRYRPGGVVRPYAGSSEREHRDGPLASAQLVSPESVAVAEDGTLYLTDAGTLRRVRAGVMDTLAITPQYLSCSRVACLGDTVYVLSDPWQADDGYFYGIFRLAGNTAEMIFQADAQYSATRDMAFGPDGQLWLVLRNEGVGQTWLVAMTPGDPNSLQTVATLPDGAAALTLDELGRVYIAVPESGVIWLCQNGQLTYFAGSQDERAFVDGPAPQFYLPQRLAWQAGWLYVWDFNVLRRVAVADGLAGEAETVAGQASPTFDLEPPGTQAAQEAVLPGSALADFALLADGSVLITDPKRGMVWAVN